MKKQNNKKQNLRQDKFTLLMAAKSEGGDQIWIQKVEIVPNLEIRQLIPYKETMTNKKDVLNFYGLLLSQRTLKMVLDVSKRLFGAFE